MLSGHFPELDLTATALKVLQLVTLCHYHWIQAWRVLQRRPLSGHVWFPVLGLFSIYTIVVTSLGMLDVASSWTECLSNYLSLFHRFLIIAVILVSRIITFFI